MNVNSQFWTLIHFQTTPVPPPQEDPNPYEYISTTEPLVTTPAQVYLNSTGDILSQLLTNNDLNLYGWLTILFTVPSLLLTHPLLMNCVFSAFERTWELQKYTGFVKRRIFLKKTLRNWCFFGKSCHVRCFRRDWCSTSQFLKKIKKWPKKIII